MRRAKEEKEETACGVHVQDLLLCSYAGWVKVITYFFDGEAHDYHYPLGTARQTLREAQARAIAAGCEDAAEHQFLHDVEINQRFAH
jgi:hypothetical protein